MEWYTALAVVLIIILTIILGVILAYTLAKQRCTVSIQQRRPNHELTKVQHEEEEKRQRKFSSKLKRAFRPSSQADKPIAPVEDVRTVEFTLKMGDSQKNSEQLASNDESAVVLLPQARVTQAEIDERQKKRDEIRKKYNL